MEIEKQLEQLEKIGKLNVRGNGLKHARIMRLSYTITASFYDIKVGTNQRFNILYENAAVGTTGATEKEIQRKANFELVRSQLLTNLNGSLMDIIPYLDKDDFMHEKLRINKAAGTYFLFLIIYQF